MFEILDAKTMYRFDRTNGFVRDLQVVFTILQRDDYGVREETVSTMIVAMPDPSAREHVWIENRNLKEIA